MLQGSFASVGSEKKRRRPLPLPKGNADMQPFTPDSSVASDVIPSANYGDRAMDRAPDMILLHYTGMPDVEGAGAAAPRHRRLGAHVVLKTAACNVPEAKRMARRASSWAAGTSTPARSARDHQSRAHWVIRNSAAPDRRRDRAVPRHHARRNVPRIGCSDIPTWRGAFQEGSRRKILAFLANSGVGHWGTPRRSRGETLKLGSEGDDVRGMQEALNGCGIGQRQI